LESSEEPTLPSSSAFQIRSDYQNLIRKAESLFPQVDQTLLMDMLKLESKQRDWQGTVILEIRYSDQVSLDDKIDELYNKYERVPSEKDDRTLRFKAMHIDIEELERLLKEDPEIDRITGSAQQTQKDEYPLSR
jgi:DNA-binding transcriptional regulator YbjK